MPPATTTRLGGICGSRPDFAVLTVVRVAPYNGAVRTSEVLLSGTAEHGRRQLGLARARRIGRVPQPAAAARPHHRVQVWQ
jgi:hypothetical protein